MRHPPPSCVGLALAHPHTPRAAADTLSAAAAVLAVEAYHAGAVRTLLADLVAEGADTPFGPVEDVVQLISDLRDAVDGPEDLDQGIGSYGDVNIVPADADGLVFSRSVSQVLAIVYLGGDGAGGFFPKGVTGFFGPQVRVTPRPRGPAVPCSAHRAHSGQMSAQGIVERPLRDRTLKGI